MSAFNKLDNSDLPIVNNGRAENISQFFDQLIKPQFNNKDVIKKTHSALLQYVNSANPVFFVRLYGSYPKDKYLLQRRGFVSEYKDKTRVAFCDNTFSLLFTGMKIAGIPYGYDDLKDLFNQDKLVVGFGQVSQEKELCFYSPKGAKRANLNTKGWYQAHIKPTGYGFNDLDLKKLFPNPPRHEYSREHKVRYVNENLTQQQEDILKAHFLRLVHPLNSFLEPKRTHLQYNGVNIGEENELINCVRDYIKDTFSSEYKEFDDLSFKYEIEQSSRSLGNIRWFEKPKSVKQTIPTKPSPVEKKSAEKGNSYNSPESEVELNLEKSLRAIGKEVFAVILYPELSKNMAVKYHEIAEKYDVYKGFTINSQSSRLSKAKAIFKAGEEPEALLNIYDSGRIKDEVKAEILQYLKEGI